MLKTRRLSALQRQRPNFSLGQRGEDRAVTFLRSREFQILDRNVRYGNHEVDIVALDPVNGELIFVEVKTRATNDFGNPSTAVTRAKLRSLALVADRYRRAHHLHGDYRFDIVAVLPKTIEHFQNVTWSLQ